MLYQWDFDVVLSYTNFWLDGAMTTLIYAAATILGGLVIGVICGSILLLRNPIFKAIPYTYVQIFRCTPLLVQIVWFFYALPIVINVFMPAWLAGGIGLTLYMGAFSTEIFRGGVMSIDKGQWQAGRALGMTYLQLMRRIILPQAATRMVPPFVNQSVLQLKNTSLLYVVAVPDLMYTSQIIVSETFRPLEGYTSVAIMYFILLYPLVKFASRLEARADV